MGDFFPETDKRNYETSEKKKYSYKWYLVALIQQNNRMCSLPFDLAVLR